MLPSFERLPPQFQTDTVKCYHSILYKKRHRLIIKRMVDIIVAFLSILILIIPMSVIGILIKATSKGPVFYKQKRITALGKQFNIIKFRTMYEHADESGMLLTYGGDTRITGLGKYLRKFRLDEIPQIFHVLSGKMSIVGTRPEVPKYVNKYTDEMMATLLLPAGITSLASIMFKNEEDLLEGSKNPEKEYIDNILPQKMKYNLDYLSNYRMRNDFYLMVKTIKNVFITGGGSNGHL